MKTDLRKQILMMYEQANIKGLVKIVSTLDDEAREIILGGIASQLSETKKKALMDKIKSSTAVTDQKVRGWLVQGMSSAYVHGLNRSNDLIKKFDINVGKRITVEVLKTAPEMRPHLQAVNALLSDAYLDFGNSMNGFIKGSEHILNDALKQQIRSEIAIGRLQGTAIDDIMKNVKDTIGQQGFSVLIDKGGKSWSLDTYSEMLARPHLLKANNEAVINRAGDFEIDIVEVSDHNTETPLCQEFEGKIYSISGKSDKYPPLPEEPPFHPSCKHSLLLRPDLE